MINKKMKNNKEIQTKPKEKGKTSNRKRKIKITKGGRK
jgi:hypothetical protein